MSTLQERDVLIEPWFSITISGKLIPEEMLRFVSEVSIEDAEDSLPLGRITVLDSENLWGTASNIVKGNTIVIKGGHRKNNKQLLEGKITHIEADYPEEGYPTITIAAIDKAIDLMKARKPRTWKSKKISDVINIMLKEAGLKGKVSDTGVVQEHVQQEEETNLEFIMKWREILGWRFHRQKDGSYYFGPRLQNEKTIDRLSYRTEGMEIKSFSPVYVDPPTEDENVTSDYDNEDGAKHYANLKRSGL